MNELKKAVLGKVRYSDSYIDKYSDQSARDEKVTELEQQVSYGWQWSDMNAREVDAAPYQLELHVLHLIDLTINATEQDIEAICDAFVTCETFDAGYYEHAYAAQAWEWLAATLQEYGYDNSYPQSKLAILL